MPPTTALPCLMADADGITTIRTLDEWTAFVVQDPTTPALLQCGTPKCERCPAFGERIKQLKQAYNFRHAYANLHDVDEDLTEELQVTMLPAFRIVAPEDTALDRHTGTNGQNATHEDLTKAIQATCSTRLLFSDDDF